VRPRAFQVKAADTEHSVYRTAHLSHRQVCDAGRWHAAPQRKKAPKGYARLAAAKAIPPLCRVEASEPPKRHAHMTDWPATKEERMSVAQQIAASCELCLVRDAIG